MKGAIIRILFFISTMTVLYPGANASDTKASELVMGPSPKADIRANGATEIEILTIPGMPPVVDPSNIYSETAADKLAPALRDLPPRVYVPNE